MDDDGSLLYFSLVHTPRSASVMHGWDGMTVNPLGFFASAGLYEQVRCPGTPSSAHLSIALAHHGV